MSKRNNRSSKAAIVSTVVITAMVGASVFALHVVADTEKDINANTVNNEDGIDSAVVGKLLPVEETETAAEVVEKVVVAEPEIPAEPVIVPVDVNIVVVDNVVNVEEETTAAPVVAPVVEEETEAEIKVAAVEEVVYDATPVIEVNDSLAYVPVEYYEEPTWTEESYESDWTEDYYENDWEDDYYYDDNYEEPDTDWSEPDTDWSEPDTEWSEPDTEWSEPDTTTVAVEADTVATVADAAPAPTTATTTASAANLTLGQQIVDYAEQYVGVTPYVSYYDREYSSLDEGTDCSGFVNLIYDNFDIYASPASDDYADMYNVSYEDLQPGDIVVYRDGGHVGIYAGDDTIIHCANEEIGTIEGDMFYNDPTGYVRLY